VSRADAHVPQPRGSGNIYDCDSVGAMPASIVSTPLQPRMRALLQDLLFSLVPASRLSTWPEALEPCFDASIVGQNFDYRCVSSRHGFDVIIRNRGYQAYVLRNRMDGWNAKDCQRWAFDEDIRQE